MAARRDGSAADGLVLYSALDWKERVHIVDRDCGISAHLTDPVKAVSSGSATFLADGIKEMDPRNSVETTIRNDVLMGSVKITKWDANIGCTEASGATSMVGINLHEGYKDRR